MEIIPETIKNYKKIIKHLKSHIAEGKYDDLDIEQLMMLENEIDVLEKTKSIYSGERILAVKAPKTNKIYTVSNPKKAQSNAFKYLGNTAELFLGDGKYKYQIYNPYLDTWIKFGDVNYEDYLKHKNEDRKNSYIKRATNIRGDWEENPYSRNNLSINILWS